ncbi:CHC2 zinc finger domain-containing protein [Faecalibacterium taiwanense]|uniref:CHC2 zinc finger domain-containing protein n=1 Tax=Faecalibacterium taiwanense TaxID=3030638 RepID=UPI003AB0EF6D
MNLFETVKNNVSLREAAQAYGLEVNRHGKALCPFHNDRHPSLYVANDHYYCFTCGEHGRCHLTSLQGCLISSPTTQP